MIRHLGEGRSMEVDEMEEVPRTFNFARDVVDRWAQDPARQALIWCNHLGEVRRYSFADIKAETDRLAKALQDRGIGKGDRVIVMLARIPAWQISMVALLKIGAVAIPAITMLTQKDIAYRIDNSGAVGVITTAADTVKFADVPGLRCRLAVGGSPAGWEDLATTIAAAGSDYRQVEVEAEDPAIIYYTSGSTGNPKGVTHASRALHAWRGSAEHWLDLSPQDVMYCTADTGWSKAGTSILFGPWSQGATVLFYDGPFDASERIALIERHGVTVFCAAATEFRHLIHLDFTGRDLSRLRLAVSAGESVNPEIYNRWTEITGRPLLEAYGLTETLMLLVNSKDRLRRPGSMGRPLPGLQIEIVTAEGTIGGIDEVGQVALRLPSPQMMLYYWGDPERTRATRTTIDGTEYFLTGDNARRDADGLYHYVGRSDDIINSAGYRIGPQEVENALMEHPAIREAAVVASPDPERGEIVKAFVTLHAGYRPGDDLVLDIQNFVKRVTAPYKYPRKVEFVDELPKSVVGKLQRRILRNREFQEKDRR